MKGVMSLSIVCEIRDGKTQILFHFIQMGLKHRRIGINLTGQSECEGFKICPNFGNITVFFILKDFNVSTLLVFHLHQSVLFKT